MATFRVKLTPLVGEEWQPTCCFLLEIDSAKILLDCGWEESFNPKRLERVASIAPSLHAVLLTHPDVAHIGALPYLVGKCDLKAPVYCTLPVQSMGEHLLLDHVFSRNDDEDFTTYTMEDVFFALRNAHPLKYQQPHALKDAAEGITITAYPAGHTLGGSIWAITVGGEQLVYAPTFNHRKERLLNSGSPEVWFSSRPALFLTHTFPALHAAPPDRVTREKQLTDSILTTLRGDGHVLMPVDTSARVLELVLLLERHWADNKLPYPLILLTKFAAHTLELATSQLPWMSDQINRQFEQHLDNPFDYKSERDKKEKRRLIVLHELRQLKELPPGPKVVLASPPSMAAGYSRHLLAEWGPNPKNLVLMTQTAQGEVSERLVSHARGGSSGSLQLELLMKRKVPLEGEELEAFLAAQQKSQPEEAPGTPGTNGAAPAALAAVSSSSPSTASRQNSGGSELRPLRSNTAAISRLIKDSSGAVVQKLKEEDGGAAHMLGASEQQPQVLMDGFKPPEGAVSPMFPDEDEPFEMEWTPYGLKLDMASLGLATDSQAEAKDEVMEEEEEEPEEEQPPSKVVEETINLELQSQVRFVDFDGRADGYSIQAAIRTMAPRHLLLLGGPSPATSSLEKSSAKNLTKYHTRIHTPDVGQEVEVTIGPVRAIALQDNLIQSLQLHDVEGHSFAWMDARVLPPAEQGGLSQLGPKQSNGPSSEHGGVFMTDIRLSDILELLVKAGLPCDFQHGALSCRGGMVVVRKDEDGGIVLEGALSDEYFTVRDILYTHRKIC